MRLNVSKIKQSYQICQQPQLDSKKLNVIENDDNKINCVITRDSINIANENLAIIRILHSLLLNCSNLSSRQKLDYCKSERYFMKLFLNEIIKDFNLRSD
ncbi:MAG: hypothetical protein ACFFA6_06840 [Promethearchaeota archaeon]